MDISKIIILPVKKSLIRLEYKEIRKNLYSFFIKNPEEIMRIHKGVIENLLTLPIFVDLNKNKNSTFIDKNKKLLNISLYYPIKSEINVIEIFKNFVIIFQEKNKDSDIKIKFSLPSMSKENFLKFYEYENEESLIENRYKIKEPNPLISAEILPDIIITPLISFDKYKNRLGYGKGYYDNTFLELKKLNKKFITIGIAYDEQLYPNDLPIEEHDYKLDYIVTPTIIYI